jgi:Ternary complex associated domain 9
MSRRIDVQFFSPEEEDLFQRCLDKMPHTGEVIVQQLGRIGFSGAKVFMFFPNGANSRPHVGKIHTYEGIQRELEGLDLAYNYFDDAGQQKFHVHNEKEGMIAIPLIGDASADGRFPAVSELKDLLFSKAENTDSTPQNDAWFSCPIQTLLGIIDLVYAGCLKKATSNRTIGTCVLGNEYEWYLRKDATEPMLGCFLGTNKSDQLVNFFEKRLPNPLIAISKIRAIERELPLSTVHGDLHPSNVVLDTRGVPHLLDFTWCRDKAHVLKDFLVMECSIRFLMMPQHLNWETQYLINETFLEITPDGISNLKRELDLLGVEIGTLFHIERCATIVLRLRYHAAIACGDSFSIIDYVACQALVLYGLMRIDRYPFGNCTLALAQMAGFLRDRDFS